MVETEAHGLAGFASARRQRRTRPSRRPPCDLFRSQGYEATTVEQIAEAAEVSPSTFFRYFPTKEDVVIHDALDPLLFAAFVEQPPELSPHPGPARPRWLDVFGALTPDELALELERQELITSVPELRARMLDDLATTFRGFAEALAARIGTLSRRPVCARLRRRGARGGPRSLAQRLGAARGDARDPS